ncbi:hypothetical protein ACFVYA_48695 [Amycolatopsis sp. NPDC058278]|uniref:hypothetical protein n=1 Tax=Amycolatopsis sp. NPDC058278 TaxID=3346417 RepID=UPI0036D9967B
MSDETTEGPKCSKCGQNSPGESGISCSRCFDVIDQTRLPGAVVDDFERRQLIAEAVGAQRS